MTTSCLAAVHVPAMSSVPDDLRRFIGERLTAAAEEIFGVFHRTLVHYEEEIERQRKLLDIVWKPEIKLHRIEVQKQHVCKEEEVVQAEQQQLWNQERNSRLDQEEPEPPQIKEEQEELCSSPLGLKQEPDDFILTSTCEENDQSEDQILDQQPDRSPEEAAVNVCSVSSTSHHVAEGKNEKGIQHKDSELTEKELNPPESTSQTHANDVHSPAMLETHSVQKSLICDTCGKHFMCRRNLQIHKRTHTGEKPYACSICGKGFTQNGNLMVHIRRHTGEKPYLCKTCGKGFTETSSLARHARVHTGERPFICKACGKRFVTKAGLIRHMRVHTGEKPYMCNTCGQRFTTKSDLSVHTRRAHTGETPCICKICGKGFIDSPRLLRHKRTHQDG